MMMNLKKVKFKMYDYIMDCQPTCAGYIPSRKFDDVQDLNNPFITKKFKVKTHDSPKCHDGLVYKMQPAEKKKDELFIILSFLFVLLIAKLMYK